MSAFRSLMSESKIVAALVLALLIVFAFSEPARQFVWISYTDVWHTIVWLSSKIGSVL